MSLANNSKKKIMFVISSLVGGGAEHVVVNLINNLDRKKYEILLVIFENKLDLESNLNIPIKIVFIEVIAKFFPERIFIGTRSKW